MVTAREANNFFISNNLGKMKFAEFDGDFKAKEKMGTEKSKGMNGRDTSSHCERCEARASVASHSCARSSLFGHKRNEVYFMVTS